jgi:hypothetical protein|tara:strand:- start:391 stop:666 length:276 start_codon:yes stop_codon:yes gene_type:complete
MTDQMLEMITNLGGTMTSLIACFWYIRYLTDTHRDRENQWMTKDTESDKALRELQSSSNAQLLGVLTSVNTTLKDMTVAISELKMHLENTK